ncbi:spore germination protein [Alkalihalobacillus oceani]|uniref:endospore germination permease n=1 Tax=Halalkalibacter oceani TaxID=1653776 RepID=UPI00203EB454|nr:endospore germination permease [Halalkalibacter oceani]MCM3761365.1 spore germination protein [Halalkalibacter oceani]
MRRKITITQLFSIFLLSTGFSNHVILTPILIGSAGRDSWLSVLIGYGFMLLFSILLVYVTGRFQEKSCLQWISMTVGKVGSRIIAFFLLIYLFVTGWTSIEETVNWTSETYLLNTPELVLALGFLLPSFFIAYHHLNLLAICAGIILPFVIILGVFVSIGTMIDKNYELITPFLVENRWQDVLHGSVYVIGSGVEIFLFIFMQHEIRRTITFFHLALLNTFLAVLTAGPLIGSIAIFGVHEAKNIRYPSFFQWRLLRIGDYFNHVDFLAIYQWSAGNLMRIALVLYLITHLLSIKEKKKRILVQLCICLMFIILILLPISNEMLLSFLHLYYIMGAVFGCLLTGCIALFIKFSR